METDRPENVLELLAEFISNVSSSYSAYNYFILLNSNYTF
jgi:hypothetical protein